MADLIYLLNSLTNVEGDILVPDFLKDVPALTEEEKKLYETVDFDVDIYHKEIGANALKHKGHKVS